MVTAFYWNDGCFLNLFQDGGRTLEKIPKFFYLGGATEEQKEEFLEEIKLMKLIGYHRHVLNLLACCTNTVPMFLVTEFAKYGDLLNFLRKRREQVRERCFWTHSLTEFLHGYKKLAHILTELINIDHKKIPHYWIKQMELN